MFYIFFQYDLHFLKKIAPGSETSNILVGETTFLTTQITVFIRLKEAVLLGDLTEVPVPTRFLFIHLGTIGNAAKYREIGRSMGVLMSDEVKLYFFPCKLVIFQILYMMNLWKKLFCNMSLKNKYTVVKPLTNTSLILMIFGLRDFKRH